MRDLTGTEGCFIFAGMKKIVFPACFLLLIIFKGNAQPDSTYIQRIADKYVSLFMQDSAHVGLSIGIIKDDVRYTFNCGTTEIGKKRAPTTRTIYEIASVTKTFTGILLAHAVLEKKIGLEDDIRKYMPGAYPNLAYQGHPVRVVDLANHTAGFAKFIPAIKDGSTWEERLANYTNFSAVRFLDALTRITLDTMPGSRFGYSDADSQLLGIILEQVYHANYADLVQRYICGPATMPDTRTEVPGKDVSRMTKEYDGKGQLMPELLFIQTVPASMYLKSTVSDMLQFLQLNLDEHDPAIYLSHQPTFHHTAEHGDDIGLCWFIRNVPGDYRLVRHAGGSFGSTSYCAVYPERHTGIVCLANDAGQETEHEMIRLADEIMKEVNR